MEFIAACVGKKAGANASPAFLISWFSRPN